MTPASQAPTYATTMGACVTTTLDCTVCCETKNSGECVQITDDPVCRDCFNEHIRPMFLEALQHEHAYPVKWGQTNINPVDFANRLPAGFVLQWVWREREYKTPVKERVYCRHQVYDHPTSPTGAGQAPPPRGSAANTPPMTAPEIAVARQHDVLNLTTRECGRFLGEKAPPTDAACTRLCIFCQGTTCGICASGFTGAPNKHTCDEREEEDPFKGLQRGKGYQLCPSCGVHVNLRDGCNHIICTQAGCGAAFCYICGEKVGRHEKEHFKPGKPCPRWNQPGSNHAHHDTVTVRVPDMPRLDVRRPLAPLPPWERDAQTRQALIAIHHLHTQAHAAESINRHDPDAQAMLRLTHALRANIIAQFYHPDLLVDVHIANQHRAAYLLKENAITHFVARYTPDEWEGLDPGLLAAVDLYGERHDPFLALLDARVTALWAERMQHLPPFIDRRLYPGLIWPPSNRAAAEVAHGIARHISSIPEASRTPLQHSVLRLTMSLDESLTMHVLFEAVSDVHTLEHVQVDFAERHRIIRRESEEIVAAVGNGESGLKLAVGVYLSERWIFEEKLALRIGRLRAGRE